MGSKRKNISSDQNNARLKTTSKRKTAESSSKRKTPYVDSKRKKTSPAKNRRDLTERDRKMHISNIGRYGKISSVDHENNIKIAFLGGINEIGKNLTVFEYKNDIIIVDCGMSFPDADLPGVDYVIPDMTYLEDNADRIKALFITHGHEDHIGSVPYLLKTVNIPVYCTGLTGALVENKLKDHRMLDKCNINTIYPGDTVKTGSFSVEAIHVNHSIPDAVAFAVYCDDKIIVHTGDFKIDNTPIDGGVIDLSRFAELGNEGVLLLMSDSTNAERPGFTDSEKKVGETLDNLFIRAGDRRIIVASFASNIHRIQQIIDFAEMHERKIFLCGRSLENVTKISTELEYLNAPEGLILPIEDIDNYSDKDIVIITTGSQGEQMSGLSRMSLGEHRKVKIGENDFVIISATPIPGNEKAVTHTINELMRLGAEVIYEKTLGIHVSGHCSQEEQKLLLNLVKPQYFIPVHGEQKHLRKHAASALSVGIAPENILIPDLGDLVEIGDDIFSVADTVRSGEIYIDASGIGNVESEVLKERRTMSNDGVIVITALMDSNTDDLFIPLVVDTSGLALTGSHSEFSDFISDVCQKPLNQFKNNSKMDIQTFENKLKDAVSKAVSGRLKRHPVVFVTVLYV